MDTSGKHNDHHSAHHVVPLSVYNRVFGSLVVLTVVTVAVSFVDFGTANTFIAMLIATVKALLVVMFFMGLRYEGQENNVTFFCTFVFLALFVGLSSADLFYRVEPTPVKVDESELPQAAAPVDVNKFAKPSPELLNKAKGIFTAQCIVCHGAAGAGDGPAAASLVPPPRNFTKAEGWKNGRTLSGVVKTLNEGIQGSGMPAFTTIPAEDRIALAHYVRSLGPSIADPSAEELAAVQKLVGGASKPRISVDKAMEKMAREWEAAH